MAKAGQHQAIRVFISYSRKDHIFARVILTALVARGYEPFLDEQDILPGEDWKRRLGDLILNAAALVFVISPDSIVSEHCVWEVEEAARLCKRILPVVYRPILDDSAPASIKRWNYISMTELHDQAAALDKLANALKVDINWVREHTWLGEQAARWERERRAGVRLLRGAALEQAEDWLLQPYPEGQAPTAIQRAFINASRKAAQIRRYWLAGTAFIAMIVITAGTATVLIQRKTAELQRAATAEQESHRLAKIAGQETLRGDAATGMLIALAALPDPSRQPERPYVELAEYSLVQAWQLRRELAVLTGHLNVVSAARFDRDGQRILTTSSDGTARLWDAGSGSLLQTFHGHEAEARNATFSPDGLYAATGDWGGKVRIWEVANGRLVRTLVGHETRIDFLDFSADGQILLSGAHDGSIRLWNVQTGNIIGRHGNSSEKIMQLALNADAAIAVTHAQNGEIRIRDITKNSVLAELIVPGRLSVNKAVLNPQRDRVAVFVADSIQLWDARAARMLANHGMSAVFPRAAVFSADGRWLVTTATDRAHVWNAETGEIVSTLIAERFLAWPAISPDARTVAGISSRGTVYFWDRATGQPKFVQGGIGRVEVSRGHGHSGRHITFSPDGKMVVTASDDSTARLWSVDQAIRIRPLVSSLGVETSAFLLDEYGPSFRQRMIESRDALLAYARKSAPRCLTPKQLEELLLGKKPPDWCIDMKKWPYHTETWGDWLVARKRGESPPQPN